MKKLIISLSVLAIANLSFNSPAMSQLRSGKEVFEIFEYLQRAEDRGVEIYKIDLKSIILDLTIRACDYEDFDSALNELKRKDYLRYASFIVAWDADSKKNKFFPQLFLKTIKVYCPEKTVKYPHGFF